VLLYTHTETEGKQMLRTLGWLTIIGIGIYTGILQMMLVFVGALVMWVGTLLATLGGGL
jgi:hypothetical protein